MSFLKVLVTFHLLYVDKVLMSFQLLVLTTCNFYYISSFILFKCHFNHVNNFNVISTVIEYTLDEEEDVVLSEKNDREGNLRSEG